MLFLDIVTTGLDFNNEGKIVEITIIDKDKTILFHSLNNLRRSISLQAAEVHGIKEKSCDHQQTL